MALPTTERHNALLDSWRGATVRPVVPFTADHTVHAYFNRSPENPSGDAVLYYRSGSADGHRGVVEVLERATGRTRVLSPELIAEDAHRVAAQQWIGEGDAIAYQADVDADGRTAVVDVASGEEIASADGWLLGWGAVGHRRVPLYGPHWAPGENRDLVMLDIDTNAIETVLSADRVTEEFETWIRAEFGASSPISIFFPILSPDGKRVLFKLSSPRSGRVRDEDASHREGLFCLDLATSEVRFLSPWWGHPSWHPDSVTIIQTRNLLINSITGEQTAIAGLADFGSGHPSSNHEGTLMVTDTTTQRFGGPLGEWAIALGAMPQGGEVLWLHTFDHSSGATSWRVSHPHPVFSENDARIYFNIATGGRTSLYVAEQRTLQ